MTEVGSLRVTAGNFIICSLHGNIVTKIMHAHMYITHTHVIALIQGWPTFCIPCANFFHTIVQMRHTTLVPAFSSLKNMLI